MVIPVPIVSVLFERGAFDRADTWPTALAVAVYGAGLPAFVMQKVISPLYYAREDTRSPFRYAVHAMIVNAAIALGLAPFIGFIAAALGTTVAGWVMLVQLWRGTRGDGRRRRARRPPPPRGARGSRSPAWPWARSCRRRALLAGALADPLLRYGALALLVAIGMAAYGAAALAFGALRPADIRAALRSSKSSSDFQTDELQLNRSEMPPIDSRADDPALPEWIPALDSARRRSLR